jgi:hypothetical protein
LLRNWVALGGKDRLFPAGKWQPEKSGVVDIEVGQAAVRAKAEGFALSVAPIIAGILNSGIGSDAGIAEALNARGIATARGGRWHPQTVKNVRARAARIATEGVPCG